jgi:integrin beta 3
VGQPAAGAAPVPRTEGTVEAEPATVPPGEAGVADLNRQRQDQRRLRMVALALVSLLVLGALPLTLLIRAATRDPVFNSLDDLDVPSWALVSTTDDISGSRWCFIECRYRERTIESQRSPDETYQVYEQALSGAGWQPWKVVACPDTAVEGHYTCWKRDELTLDLWVREPACAHDLLRLRPTVEAQAKGVDPSGSPAADAPPDNCGGAVVSLKVRNAIADERGKPQPSIDPSLIGETPDAIYTEDPLATPSPS